MMKSFGKLILAGEHAVVYGKPAIILPIDKFCEAGIREIGERRGIGEVGRIKIINLEEDKHGLVDFVIKEFLQEFQVKNSLRIQIEINSNIPVGRGFGSSAAVITAVVKELMEFFHVGGHNGVPVKEGEILDFCISCENFIHKNSSGADVYAAWFGKPMWFRKESRNVKLFRELGELREVSELWKNSYLVDTGKPVESTGQMVQIAAKLKNTRPKFFEKQVNLIERRTLLILQNLITPPQPKSLSSYVSIHESIIQIEKCLEKIGVVSKEVRHFIKDLRIRQIPAKICGAGGKTTNSGVVIAFTKDKKMLEQACRAYNYSILDVKILP